MATAQVFVDGTGWRSFSAGDLPSSGVTAGSYGDGTHVGAFTVAANGTITAASNVTITGGGGGGGPTVYDYVPVASSVTVTATSAATAQAIVDGNAVTYDGATPVEIKFYCYFAAIGAAGYAIVDLWDGATDLGRIAQFHGSGAGDGCPITVSRFLTPTAASHTYHVKGWVAAAGSATFFGAPTDPGLPIYLRITGA